MIGLSNMVTPRIEGESEARNYGKYVVGPLERGYGITLGNALRRVLLSSLEGTAVTSIRITDVQHEFSEINGVREDVVQVMLQLKKLRMKLHDTNEARLRLFVRGEGVVTAADIQSPPEIEIVNPDLYLLTVDDPKVELEIEMVVERGRGYSPSSDRSGRLPIGELPIDAIYNPVRRVNWEVGSARVGQSTNYDKLIVEIWTDGTVPPEEALSTGAKLLIEQLRHIAQVDEVPPVGAIAEGEEPGTGISHEIKETPIENLDLSVRVFNSLKRAGITTVGEVLDLMDKGEEQIKTIRNFGDKSFEELLDKMREKGYLQDEDEDTGEEEAE